VEVHGVQFTPAHLIMLKPGRFSRRVAYFNVVSNPGRGTLISIEIPANLPDQ
jgi:hypothetical protein